MSPEIDSRRGAPRAALACVVTLTGVLAAHPAPAGPPAPWQTLEPGLELGVFPAAGDPRAAGRGITVLRVDPARYELTLHTATGIGRSSGLSARAWAEREGLVAAVNAGMYDVDGRRHVGFLKDGAHVNSPRANGYLSAAAFAPRAPGDPPFRIFDLDETSIESVAARYGRVVQNLRLIARPGVNRWAPQDKGWYEAALAEDREGRALVIFCTRPLSMHDLNRRLLELPLGVVAANHLEGGAEAQLHVRVGEFRLDLVGGFEAGAGGYLPNPVAWPLPNVIGVRRRHPVPGQVP